MRTSFEIAGRRVGGTDHCFVIAEAGVNHNGDPELARRLVDAAAAAGADAVKFQTFDPDQLAAEDAPTAAYQKRAQPVGPKPGAREATGEESPREESPREESPREESPREESQREMLRGLVLTPAMHHELKKRAEDLGILFLSSPFDERSADFLEQLGVPALKIPSGELTNHPFLAHLARKGLPLLMSTGMCTLAEVGDAVKVIAEHGDPPLALFHCVSSYPARPIDANLRAMSTMRAAFGRPVGWSDHTPGLDISTAAVALGAELIEKHLTMDRELPGPDHRASLNPAQLAELIAAVRNVSAAIGDGEKKPVEAEREIARVARKSLHFSVPLAPGTTLQSRHLVALRPGTGIPPGLREALCGRVLRRPALPGQMVDEEMLEPLR
ncbi:MAG: N-acetylneuraminate synthase family protein [Myxococcales bacterium]